jgi:hypothetical protein
MAPFAGRNGTHDVADYLMFPPRSPIATQFLCDVSPFAASVCDMNTTSGLALSLMDHDPLLTGFFAGLDRRDSDY